jgi:hypothetical protein
MEDSESICLACELCCDGTVIGFVQLDSEEIPRVRKIMEIEEENGNGFFLQPCDHLCGGCNIYTERPRQCASFKCGLLTSVEENKLEFDSAKTAIAAVKDVRVSINNKVEKLQIEFKSQSFYFKMIELNNLLHKKMPDSALTPIHKELIADLKQLDSILADKFDVPLFS